MKTRAWISERSTHPYEDGYVEGWDACRSEAWFTIVTAAAFSLMAGFLAGMAFTNFVL